MAKSSLEVHGASCGAKFLQKRKVQSTNTTLPWLTFFNLKLFNLPHRNKIDINMNLNTQT